jgi:hypothetical protein
MVSSLMANCENVEGVDGMDPILGKNEPNEVWDHKPMTWSRFLKLRAWAQDIANEFQAPVYLVGSVLTKKAPRDIDVSVVFPLAVYEEKFGKISYGGNELMEREKIKAAMHQAHRSPERINAYWTGMKAIRNKTYLDLKFCPDTWWVDRDKLLLAQPIKQDDIK